MGFNAIKISAVAVLAISYANAATTVSLNTVEVTGMGGGCE